MVGTFGRALEARGIPSQPDRLSAEIEGDIVDEGGVMALRAIRIRYRVALPLGKREEAERALRFHERGCPLANTLKGNVEISYTADFTEFNEPVPAG